MTTYEAHDANQEPFEGPTTQHFDEQRLQEELAARRRAYIDGALRALADDQSEEAGALSDEHAANARQLQDDISAIHARIAESPDVSLEEGAASRRRQREGLRALAASWSEGRAE